MVTRKPAESCQIKFELSGPVAHEDTARPHPFSGDSIRGMAYEVNDKCVRNERVGGFVTSELVNSIRYICDPNIDYQEPFRE